MSDIKKLLGKKIKQLRKDKDLTQEKLAELINIEIPSLSNIETGKYSPSVETLQKLSEVLNVEPWELYYFNNVSQEKMKKYVMSKIDNNFELLKITYGFLKTLE